MDDPAGLGTHGLGLWAGPVLYGLGLWAGPMAQGPGPWAQALGTPYMGYMGYMGPGRVLGAQMGPYGLYGPIWAI